MGYAAVTIGRMVCKGKKSIEPAHLMDSCSNLKMNGNTASGNYVLNNEEVAFCDMTRLASDPSIETHVGNIHYIDNDIDNYMFVVSESSTGTLPTGYITFDTEILDSGNNFSPEDGSFSAPIDGIYGFLFSGNTYNLANPYSEILVRVNGANVHLFHDDEDSGDARLVTFYFTLDLQADDEVALY